MAGSNPAYSAILNDLNRDVSREQPTDIIQFCADWFQDKLREERSGTSSTHNQQAEDESPSSRKGPPGKLGPFGRPDMEAHPVTLSPFSEHGPTDGPFGGPRRATIAAGAFGAGSAASMFSSPFGGGNGNRSVPPPANDSSPFSENAPSGPFGSDSPFGSGSPFGASAQTPSAPVGGPPPPQSDAEDDDAHPDEPVIPQYALGRRTSVSAESLVPAHARPFQPNVDAFIAEEEDEAPVSMPVIPKTPEQLARIKAAIKPNFLFRNLDEEQEADVLAAMKEIQVGPGEIVIEQGAAGDYFYVVENGELEVYVKREGETGEGPRADLGKKVAQYKEGGSFGELALMHNAPRAASIVSITPCTLWALDRVSFRTILLDHTSRKRRLYESFLSTVPILSSLQPAERAKIADVLESRTFNAGEDVIVEGAAGDEFFLIESGSAQAIKTIDGRPTVVKDLRQGDYFGELALLNRQTRAATIRAADKLVVAALGERAFTRLLGPVKEIMARSAGERYGFAVGR